MAQRIVRAVNRKRRLCNARDFIDFSMRYFLYIYEFEMADMMEIWGNILYNDQRKKRNEEQKKCIISL